MKLQGDLAESENKETGQLRLQILLRFEVLDKIFVARIGLFLSSPLTFLIILDFSPGK